MQREPPFTVYNWMIRYGYQGSASAASTSEMSLTVGVLPLISSRWRKYSACRWATTCSIKTWLQTIYMHIQGTAPSQHPYLLHRQMRTVSELEKETAEQDADQLVPGCA